MKDHLETSIFGDHDGAEDPTTPAPPPQILTSRRQVREAEAAARKAMRRRGRGGRGGPSILRRIAVIILALAVVAGGVSVAYSYLRPVVEGFLESNDYPGPGSGSVRVTIEEGAGGASIAQLLADQDVVKSSKAFIEAAKANPKSAGIQPGVYQMRKQMKASDALAILVNPANRITSAVVIREGLWAKEIYAKLSQATGIPLADYVAAAKDPASIGLPAAAQGNVEGYLFPASYSFDPGTSAADQLKQMVAQSVQRLASLGVTPDRMEHVMTVASLVEGEARLEADRPKVARVVENRLAKKMLLQLDSTVNYAAGARSVTTTEAQRASDSPYNTYKAAGLPPGPIDNPGESAIEAAANPAPGPWLFFVTVNPTTGETKFATTFAEHEKYVAEFQAWCQANKGKC